MDDWHFGYMPATRRCRVAARLAWKALLFGGFLLIAGVTLAYAQVPPTGAPVAGVYNSVPPTFRDKTGATLQTDVNGVLKVTGVGGGVASTVAIDQTTPGTTNGVQVNAPLPAGSNIVGNVRIDQTTPGTTNGVRLNAGANIVGQVGVDQTTPGTTDSVTVKPQSYTAMTAVTLATGAAHAANDVVGAAAAAITFSGICPAASREIILTSTRLRYDTTAVPSGMTSFRLYLYNVTPPSALADDAPFDLPSGDRASFLGYLDLGSPVDLGSTLYVETNGNQKQITCASTSLFGYLVTNGAYTTVTSDVVTIVLKAVAP